MAVEQTETAGGKKKTAARKKTTKTKKTTRRKKKTTKKTAGSQEAAAGQETAAAASTAAGTQTDGTTPAGEDQAPPKKTRRTTKRIKRTKTAKRSSPKAAADATTEKADQAPAAQATSTSTGPVEPDPEHSEGSNPLDTTLLTDAGTSTATANPARSTIGQEEWPPPDMDRPASADQADNDESETTSNEKKSTAKKRSPRKRGKRKSAAQRSTQSDDQEQTDEPHEEDAAEDRDPLIAGRLPADEPQREAQERAERDPRGGKGRPAPHDEAEGRAPEPDTTQDGDGSETRGKRGRRRRGRRGRRGGDKKPQENAAGSDHEEKTSRDDRDQRDRKSAARDADELEPAPLPVPGEDIVAFVPKPVSEDEPIAKAKVATLGRGREMIVNVSGHDECRIAILADGRLEELFIERASAESHVGNIYKGRITNVEPSIQAAFVDFGLPKNGFLHISDVQPQYFPDYDGEGEDVGRKTPRRNRPLIQQCFRRGQEVIVQVTKEGVGTKGPTLTSYLSIPGRFLVMMPGMSRHGVSRKIEDEAIRREMRDMMSQLELPKGMGFIMRTAGLGRSKRELQADLSYLTRLWKSVVQRIRSKPAPAELYRESDLVTRSIRDVYTSDFERVVVDDEDVARKAKEFLRVAQPRTKTPVELYSGGAPLFHRLGIEAEIERIHQRHVPLSSGGSLVIESTEAMVTIDVNSGKFRSLDSAEETAYKINLEAAKEIARQLRLRDLGGLIVCDFIDMREDRHKRAVERALRDALRSHKERARILRMSAFGLIEMTRQRQRASILRNVYHDCPHCEGRGIIRMSESVVLDVMRVLQLAAHRNDVQAIVVSTSPDVALSILNRKRDEISQIEQDTGTDITITGEESYRSDQVEYQCYDGRQRLLPLFVNGDNGRDRENRDRRDSRGRSGRR